MAQLKNSPSAKDVVDIFPSIPYSLHQFADDGLPGRISIQGFVLDFYN